MEIDINKLSSFFFTDFNVDDFFKTKKEEFLDLFTWIFIRISLLWDPLQREEYRQFFEIKRLSLLENTPEMAKLFKKKVLVLCEKISDESITQHVKRLNHGSLEGQPYFYISGDEKVAIKVHEMFEMLSMKWENGVPFDRDRFSVFWPAHTQAIRVENIFLQALAFEKAIPLSKNALEYCRIYDDNDLSYPINFFSFSLDLEATEMKLTKNIDTMPNNPDEIDYFCDFFSQFMQYWSPRYRIGLCQRYLFSKLFKDYPDKKLYLITLLRALEKKEIYFKFTLDAILARLDDHLQNFNLSECWNEESILKNDDFFCKDPIYIPSGISKGYKLLKNSFNG